MFVRRRGCRLQVMESYRDKNGKPTNKSIGVVGVFDKKIKPELAEQLTREERAWLRGEMEATAAVCVAESRDILETLVARGGDIEDSELMDDKVYGALAKLVLLWTSPHIDS